MHTVMVCYQEIKPTFKVSVCKTLAQARIKKLYWFRVIKHSLFTSQINIKNYILLSHHLTSFPYTYQILFSLLLSALSCQSFKTDAIWSISMNFFAFKHCQCCAIVIWKVNKIGIDCSDVSSAFDRVESDLWCRSLNHSD